MKFFDFIKRIMPTCLALVFLVSLAMGAFVYWANNEWYSALAGNVTEAKVQTLQENALILTRSINTLQATLNNNEKARKVDALKNTRQQIRAQIFQLQRMVAKDTARPIDRQTLNSLENQLLDVSHEIQIVE